MFIKTPNFQTFALKLAGADFSASAMFFDKLLSRHDEMSNVWENYVLKGLMLWIDIGVWKGKSIWFNLYVSMSFYPPNRLE